MLRNNAARLLPFICRSPATYLFLLPLTCHLPASYLPLADGIIALFYRGLLELSKSFLDPFGNRRVSDSGLSADIGIATLIGETNAGSLVWPQAAMRMPFDVGQYLYNPVESGGEEAARTGSATP